MTTKRLFGATCALALVVAAVACAPMLKWATPGGMALNHAECLDPYDSSVDPSSKGAVNICYIRAVKDTALDRAKCQDEGGVLGPLAMLDPQLSCRYPAPDVGKSCAKSTDCAQLCDADTRTCTKYGIAGSASFLDKNGKRVDAVE